MEEQWEYLNSGPEVRILSGTLILYQTSNP